MKNVGLKISRYSTYLYIPYLIICFWHILVYIQVYEVYTGIYHHNHILVYTLIAWSFLSMIQPGRQVPPMLSFIDALLRAQAQCATFFRQIFIKAPWFCWGEICLFCHTNSVGRLEIMIHHTPSIICDFLFPVDFRLDILFPHIFCFKFPASELNGDRRVHRHSS